MSNKVPAVDRVSKIESGLNGADTKSQRAYDSAVNNAEDTVREGSLARHSDEYYELILSGYFCSLDDMAGE